MNDLRLIVTQILPNAIAPVIVFSSLLVATAILTESALAFLGFTDPNMMSWGSIIGNGRNDIRTAWYISAIPGVVILITILSLNLVNEGLNDALNPHLKDR
jgi:peptide/nickel transport system permease protein